jgi:hypothetical protein
MSLAWTAINLGDPFGPGIKAGKNRNDPWLSRPRYRTHD